MSQDHSARYRGDDRYHEQVHVTFRNHVCFWLELPRLLRRHPGRRLRSERGRARSKWIRTFRASRLTVICPAWLDLEYALLQYTDRGVSSCLEADCDRAFAA